MIDYESFSKDYEFMYKELKYDYKEMEKNYSYTRKIMSELHAVIVSIGNLLDLECVKKLDYRPMRKNNDENPILIKLRKLKEEGVI